ncbi:hypothetical protein [uncultured Microbacterium sp.]|uniref:hypothetical protein n=1 Tax=uncultured Microbacterium sp. TaxID=191216 RepID=UPI0035C99022
MEDAAELAGLRRRAYAPDADITDDPVALARLIELEDALRAGAAASLARAVHDRGPDSAQPAAASPAAGTPAPAAAASAVEVAYPSWHVALVAAVAAVAIVLAALAATATPPSAPTLAEGPSLAEVVPPPSPSASRFDDVGPFADDPAARLLIAVPIGGSAGDYFDVPVAGGTPPFPVAEGLRWSAPLGTFYGWELWLARSQNGRPCVALARDRDVRAKCQLPDDSSQGSLIVSVPYASVVPADRPGGMGPAESIGYQWFSDQTVMIVVGRASNDSAIIGRR